MKLKNGTWVIVCDGTKFLLLENNGDEINMDLRVVAHDETVFVGIRQFDTRIGIYGEDISLVFSPAKEGWGKGSVVSKT